MFGINARTNLNVGHVLGISLCFMLFLSKNINKNKIKEIVYVLIVFIFLLNSIMTIRNISEHMQSVAIEQSMGQTIKYAVEKYEKETGIEIKKATLVPDQNSTHFFEGIQKMQSLTERKISYPWAFCSALNYYCDRDFEKIELPKEIEDEITIDGLYPIDYDCFTEDQILFFGDILCLVVY